MYRKLMKEVHPDVGGTNEEARTLIEAYKNSSSISTPAHGKTGEELLNLYKWAKPSRVIPGDRVLLCVWN